jgi:hypothetical protein
MGLVGMVGGWEACQDGVAEGVVHSLRSSMLLGLLGGQEAGR